MEALIQAITTWQSPADRLGPETSERYVWAAPLVAGRTLVSLRLCGHHIWGSPLWCIKGSGGPEGSCQVFASWLWAYRDALQGTAPADNGQFWKNHHFSRLHKLKNVDVKKNGPWNLGKSCGKPVSAPSLLLCFRLIAASGCPFPRVSLANLTGCGLE